MMRPPRLMLLCTAGLAVTCSIGGTGCGPAPDGARVSGDEPRSNTDPASPSRRPPEMGTISGRVLSANGKPLAGCSVLPTATSRPRPPVPENAVVSKADGRYRWPLRPATYTMTAYCELPKYGGEQHTGRVTGIVVTAGEDVTADITVG